MFNKGWWKRNILKKKGDKLAEKANKHFLMNGIQQTPLYAFVGRRFLKQLKCISKDNKSHLMYLGLPGA